MSYPQINENNDVVEWNHYTYHSDVLYKQKSFFHKFLRTGPINYSFIMSIKLHSIFSYPIPLEVMQKMIFRSTQHHFLL